MCCFWFHKIWTVLILFLFLSCFAARGQERPQYIFLNTAPGRSFKVGRPSTYTIRFFDDLKKKLPTRANKKMMLGVSALFDFLSAPPDSVEKSLDRFMQLSAESRIPVLINLDGINWMNARPDLWNWWDPKKPGYNPANRKNVEWTGWDDSSALKISWRNWGTQFRVTPAPNLASPDVMEAQVTMLNRLVPRIVRWYNSLPADKKYLLGGVKLGHEASIGVNAYFYKNGNRYIEQMPGNSSLDPLESFNAEAGFSGGVTQIGYAAVSTSGIKNSGKITADDLEKVVHHFLDTLSQTAYRCGLPKALIFTHQGGTFAPWEKHLSFSAASNDYSLPGWSFYSTDPKSAGDLAEVLDQRKEDGWAAVEWWWGGAGKMEWIHNLEATLSYKNCRFLAIFNWEAGLEKSAEGLEAVKEVIEHWK
jgi:hypothetical protein